MNKNQLIKNWEKFQRINTDFIFNPDKKHVETVVKGVLKKEEETGLKLCPCRISDGSKQKNIELICPCNFRIQQTWKEKGRCWCGLFLKKK